MSLLRVVVDGEPLPAEEGIAFWKRFSAWMEEHPGDLGGFARSEGLSAVHPEMQGAAPVLVASRSATQGAYTTAPKRPAAGGSPAATAPGKGPKGGKPKPRRR